MAGFDEVNVSQPVENDEIITDSIFDNTVTPSDPVYLQDSDYELEVKSRIEEARSYDEVAMQFDRLEANEYYYGVSPKLDTQTDTTNMSDAEIADEVKGRSTVVSTDVRDTIMAIVPSLMRIFTGTENIVDFVPPSEENAEAAMDAAHNIRYIFNEDNDGFGLTHTIVKNALQHRIAMLMWDVDVTEEVCIRTMRNVSQEEAAATMAKMGDDVEVVTKIEDESDPTILAKVVLRYRTEKPSIKIRAIKPEDIRVSPFAEDIHTAPLIGSEEVVHKSVILKKGVNREVVEERTGADILFAADGLYRNPESLFYNRDDYVRYGRYYLLADSDGDGIQELHYIETIGDDFYIIEDELVASRRCAVFCGDPRPHAIIGESITGLVKDIQKIKTQILRGSLDSLAASIFPRPVFNETVTVAEDVLSDDVSAPIRTRTAPGDAVFFQQVPFVGDKAFAMLDRMDLVRNGRTGISEASKGLDPKALQSTNVMGVDAIVSGAQERIELIARLLANTGFKQLFKGLLDDIVNNPNMERTVEINGKWKTFTPSEYPPSMRVRTNPNLGRGSDVIRLQALGMVKQTQEAIIAKFGVKNQFVTPRHYYNTITEMLYLSNIRDTSKFFAPVTDEMLKQIMSVPEEPPAELLLAKAELEKVKAQVAEAIADKGVKLKEIQVDDDFNRDKLNVESILKAAEILAKGGAEPKEQPVLEGKNQQSPITQGIFAELLNGNG